MIKLIVNKLLITRIRPYKNSSFIKKCFWVFLKEDCEMVIKTSLRFIT